MELRRFAKMTDATARRDAQVEVLQKRLERERAVRYVVDDGFGVEALMQMIDEVEAEYVKAKTR